MREVREAGTEAGIKRRRERVEDMAKCGHAAKYFGGWACRGGALPKARGNVSEEQRIRCETGRVRLRVVLEAWQPPPLQLQRLGPRPEDPFAVFSLCVCACALLREDACCSVVSFARSAHSLALFLSPPAVLALSSLSLALTCSLALSLSRSLALSRPLSRSLSLSLSRGLSFSRIRAHTSTPSIPSLLEHHLTRALSRSLSLFLLSPFLILLPSSLLPPPVLRQSATQVCFFEASTGASGLEFAAAGAVSTSKSPICALAVRQP
eukprot:3704185-Rhodomonas_salina.1